MNHYANLQASLLRFCSDFKDDMLTEGFRLDTVNLDAHTDPEKWPEKDFIGVGEFTMEYDGRNVMLTAAFAVSTVADTNLFRMSELINHLVNRLEPMMSFPIYGARTGAEVGKIMILDGTRVGAPLETKSQPIQPVMVRMVTDYWIS